MPFFLRSRRLRAFFAGLAMSVAGGCAGWGAPGYPPGAYVPPPVLLNNPALVPVMDRDLVWEQVVDVVDDYFKIEHEERVRLVGDILTEGHLETYPCTGSTFFEPWKGDTVNRYERLESTLQSIRRRAAVRVIPAEGGFSIDVAVFKELEDVLRPDTGSVSKAHSLRNDNSMRRKSASVGGEPITVGWIPLGRDTALEQQILAQIQARLGGCALTAVAPATQPYYLPPPAGAPGTFGPETIPTPATPGGAIPPGATGPDIVPPAVLAPATGQPGTSP